MSEKYTPYLGAFEAAVAIGLFGTVYQQKFAMLDTRGKAMYIAQLAGGLYLTYGAYLNLTGRIKYVMLPKS